MPPGCNAIIVGLGWDCKGDVDFDASVVGLDANKNKTQLCNFANLMQQGMHHRGDNTTGAGSGDDERIRIEFGNIPFQTQELFVTVNIYT
jgi:stress response protein SCP2